MSPEEKLLAALGFPLTEHNITIMRSMVSDPDEDLEDEGFAEEEILVSPNTNRSCIYFKSPLTLKSRKAKTANTNSNSRKLH